MWLGLTVAIFYGVVAVAANFVNKYAVQVLPLPTAILLVQTITTIVLLRAMAALQLIRVPPLRSLQAHRLAPLAICYSIHALLVLYSLAFLSVPMYNTLKRLTPVMVLVMKGLADRRWPDAQTTFSVVLIVSGCMVAGAGDLSFDGQGYVIALLCALMQAAYILLAERATASGGNSGTITSSSSTITSAGSGRGRRLLSPAGDSSDVEGKSSELAPGGAEGGQKQQQQQAVVAHSTRVGGYAHPSLHLTAHATATGNGRGSSGPGSLCGPLVGGVGGGKCELSEESLAGLVAQHMQPGSGFLRAVMSCCDGPADSAGPLSATELLYSICVISVPAMAAVCVATGEGARAPGLLEGLRAQMGVPGFAVWLGVTAVTEGLLTGSIILCTQLNSALTTSIVGVLKGAVSSVLGFFLLGGVKFHVVNVAGIAMNMVGGIWYSAAQYVRQKGVQA